MLEEIASNRAERHNRRRQQRKLQTEQFLKSMQMLQANARDPEPFEDYSIFLYRQTAPKFEDRVKDLEKQFTYVPDHENKMPNLTSRTAGTDEDLAARIKSFESKLHEPQPVDKKPKDLLRAIGKIETSDWNIKEIEKKIRENKMGKPTKVYDKEKVPKWSKEQFLARQTKMEKQHLDRQDSAEVQKLTEMYFVSIAKFADIDKSIKNLDQKLKEGTVRELGHNKVASITEKLVSKVPQESKPVEKTNTRPVVLPAPAGSEFCHFCSKRVYLMERLSAEGRFFHHGCFKCQYCNTQLRLGSYAFDRDGLYDHKFFCLHHFGMVGEPVAAKVTRKPSQRQPGRSPEKKPTFGVDLLDRVQTPERAEFSNLSTGLPSSDQEESISQMDEDEWTDKNFGASCAEVDSEDDSSSLSDTDSEDEDAFDDALEEPVTKEGTMKWADRWKNSYSRKRRDSDSNGYSSSDKSSYYENSSDGRADDDSDTATEGEEEIRARELRKQEVRVEPPIVQTDTGTDTEVKSLALTKIPDILSSHNRLSISDANLNRSSDNISVNSADFNSAESGDLDLNMNKTDNDKDGKCNVIVGKLTIAPNVDDKKSSSNLKPNPLMKSATAGALSPKKPLRNFVLPPKDSRKSFGAEFKPKFKPSEPEPLLIIKRTPSKISLPKEVGKPKVAKTTPKKPLQRSETAKSAPKQTLVKQKSLPETSEEKKDVVAFNFEPEDSDLKEIDNYIEDLLANEEELQKPIDPKKYAVCQESEDEKVSSSIEDLLKALETETKVTDPVIEEKTDEKIEDLLSWMEGLDHDTKDRKVCRSFSDVKYKHLERALKSPQRSGSVVSKIPRNNLTFFELHLSGKGAPRESSDDSDDANKTGSGLKRSKTEVNFRRRSQPRSSVDLDIPTKVDIKQMLRKFESTDKDDVPTKERSGSPCIRNLPKRNSLTSFRSATASPSDDATSRRYLPRPKPIKGTISKFESEPKEFKKPTYKRKETILTKSADWSLKAKAASEPSLEETLKDLEKFVEDTIQSIGNKYEPKQEATKSGWCANVTVTSVPNYEYILSTDTAPSGLEKPEIDGSLQSTAVDETRLQSHDFSKAVASTDTSLIEDDNTDTADTKSKSDFGVLTPHDFSKAVEDTSASLEDAVPARKFQTGNKNLVVPSLEDNKENKPGAEDCSGSSDSSSFEKVHNPKRPAAKASAEDLSEEVEGDFLKITARKTGKDELYATVNKPRVDERSPSFISPPQRPMRQKSFEQKSPSRTTAALEPVNLVQPVRPQRKRSSTASPMAVRKVSHGDLQLKRNADTDNKSSSTSSLNAKRELSKTLDKQRKENAELGASSSRRDSKSKDKDCCVQ
ncbi:hypothetical protein NQ315_006324 [Exocentrus adspersus]|uniref:LIM zinc-binding domain-containing protein n=1 Tax=Exocentrus adspersus TaxID=1586481 RepID=A0AAV8VZT6_9CUCU|nr:hypothetical protein NQ315_006324 [Exocentrus adspersus]